MLFMKIPGMPSFNGLCSVLKPDGLLLFPVDEKEGKKSWQNNASSRRLTHSPLFCRAYAPLGGTVIAGIWYLVKIFNKSVNKVSQKVATCADFPFRGMRGERRENTDFW